MVSAPSPTRTTYVPKNPPVGICELTRQHCRFPVDIEGEPLHYCGAEAIDGDSWCPYHAKVVRTSYRPTLAQRVHTARMRQKAHQVKVLRLTT